MVRSFFSLTLLVATLSSNAQTNVSPASDVNAKTLQASFGLMTEYRRFTDEKVNIDVIVKASNEPAGKRLVIVRNNGASHRFTVPDSATPAADRFGANLWSLTANSSLVIEGIPENGVGTECANGAFVCTEYKVLVKRIVHNNGVAVIAGQTIVVVRAGGTLAKPNHVVKAIDPDFSSWKTDSPYLLYLKYQPDSGMFVVSAVRSFDIGANKVTNGRTRGGMRPAERAEFMEAVQKAASQVGGAQ